MKEEEEEKTDLEAQTNWTVPPGAQQEWCPSQRTLDQEKRGEEKRQEVIR